jgi:hypothetical protein
MKNKYLFILLFGFIVLSSCNKKEEPQFVPPNQEFNADAEKEKQAREEFERLKKLQEITGDSTINLDSLTSHIDSTAIRDSLAAAEKKKKDAKVVQKEKELNKKVTNPKATIDDYLEYIKRGTDEDGNFDKNMNNAASMWEGRSASKFKSAYKNVKKFTVLSEPEVVSQKGNNSTVKVKLKQVEEVNGKEQETEMTVTYNLVSDETGKWKIKNNKISKK